jgi:hypothetical protein
MVCKSGNTSVAVGDEACSVSVAVVAAGRGVGVRDGARVGLSVADGEGVCADANPDNTVVHPIAIKIAALLIIDPPTQFVFITFGFYGAFLTAAFAER